MWAQVLIILLVALLVIKPERMPELAYRLGRLIYLIKSYYYSIINKISNG